MMRTLNGLNEKVISFLRRLKCIKMGSIKVSKFRFSWKLRQIFSSSANLFFPSNSQCRVMLEHEKSWCSPVKSWKRLTANVTNLFMKCRTAESSSREAKHSWKVSYAWGEQQRWAEVLACQVTKTNEKRKKSRGCQGEKHIGGLCKKHTWEDRLELWFWFWIYSPRW